MTFEIVSPNTVQAGPVSGSAGPVTARALVTADLPSGALVNGGALGTPSSGNGSNITNVNAATLGGATFAAAGAVSGTTITGSGALKSTAGAIISHQNGSDLAGSGSFLQVENNAGDRAWLSQLSASNNLDWWFYGGSSFVKYMTLSSTGLGVTGALSATGALTTAGLKEDTSGNLGLGGTPNAGWTNTRVIELDPTFSAISTDKTSDGNLSLSWNAYAVLSDTWKYRNTGLAANRFALIQGAYKWFTAPSGTAGTAIAFTQAMTLDASGNLSNLGVIKTGVFTVGTLPSASAVGVGSIAFVTDANTTVILGLGLTVIGGGSNKVPVYSDGTNWIVG
jgi:hypothetical protein